jgi:hypothetical protein
MFVRALSIVAMLATVIGSIYVILDFYRPSNEGRNGTLLAQDRRDAPGQAQPRPGSGNDVPASNPSLNIGSGVRIQQNSTGNGSPNIVSGGNVVVQGR